MPCASQPNDGGLPNSDAALCLRYQMSQTPWPPSRIPACTASCIWKAGTTEPAATTSNFSRPPVISSTFLA